MTFGILWMVAQALMPFTIGRGIQEGIVEDDGAALARWALLLLGLGLVVAFAGVMRHRFAVQNWLRASFLLVQVVAHHVARTGPAVRARVSTGEVVATVSNDALRAGGAFDIAARASGAIVSYVVVAAILLSSSVVLGLVVLVGVPLLVVTLGGVIKPLQARQRAQREEVGRLTALGADTAAGLRVLRGIGGEQAFFDRYHERSQRVRRAGVDVATPQSTLDAAQVLLPGIFVVVVTWLGARFVLSGRIDAGDLVAFYGYAAFLVIPLRTGAEAVDKITRALVGARRMVDVLAVEPVVTEPETPLPEPAPGAWLVDERSGVAIEPGLLTCIASAFPDESTEIATRLGRLSAERGVRLGDRPLEELAARRPAPADRRQRAGADPLLGRAARPARPVAAGPVGRRRPRSARRRERTGRARCAARGPRRDDRRARPVVLRRATAAARPRARAARRSRDSRARRADERGRRPHGGAHRARPASRARRPDDGDRDDEPARARPGRPRRSRRGRLAPSR